LGRDQQGSPEAKGSAWVARAFALMIPGCRVDQKCFEKARCYVKVYSIINGACILVMPMRVVFSSGESFAPGGVLIF